MSLDSGAERAQLGGCPGAGSAPAAQTRVRAVDGHVVNVLEGVVEASVCCAFRQQIVQAVGLASGHRADHAEEAGVIELRPRCGRAARLSGTCTCDPGLLRLQRRLGKEWRRKEPTPPRRLVDRVDLLRRPPSHRRDQPEVAGERQHEHREEEPVDDMEPAGPRHLGPRRGLGHVSLGSGSGETLHRLTPR
jgi:hypothetical protein